MLLTSFLKGNSYFLSHNNSSLNTIKKTSFYLSKMHDLFSSSENSIELKEKTNQRSRKDHFDQNGNELSSKTQ